MTAPSAIQSYAFKLGSNRDIQQGYQRLLGLTAQAVEQLLPKVWTTDWIERLGTSTLKAYKIIDEEQVKLVIVENDQPVSVYLPSRIRRSIAEAVGRILRSQYERMCCFNDIKCLVPTIGLEGNLNELVHQYAYSLQFVAPKYYKWQLIRQTLRQLRRLYFKYQFDTLPLAYTTLVHPHPQSITLPYAADDGQAFKIRATTKKLHYEVKLPLVAVPHGTQDWQWFVETLVLPKKLRGKLVTKAESAPHLPDLRIVTLKGGKLMPMLQFAWSMQTFQLNVAYYDPKRILAVDLGEIHLLTSVVGCAGSQVTPPLFYRVPTDYVTKIDTIYQLIARLQRKVANYPPTWRGHTRRQIEITRLHRKLTHCRKEQLYLAVKALLGQAAWFGCGTIVLEDLRSYSPPAGQHALSRRLSNWFRGWLFQILKWKVAFLGIAVKTVPAYWTSSYCPRCGHKGHKVVDSRSCTENTKGRYFWCPHCHFRADRDYIGALNIYRVFRLPKAQQYRIATAKPVFYRKAVLPPDRSGGIPMTA